ncbi:MAG: hypothetical protein M3Z50_04360 [Actinomycetota bacterium]|nr:hypothetical protein [Actinomycetota bacterium]
MMAAVSVAGAKYTGGDFKRRLLAAGVVNRWIAIHQARANVLFLLVIALAVVLLVAAVVTTSASGTVRLLVAVVVVGLAAATLSSVCVTGDSGARAVWGGR